jgi:uncharacterized membrane protein YfcA
LPPATLPEARYPVSMKTASDRCGIVRQLLPWLVWLVAFYTIWLALLAEPGNAALVRAHWPIAATMLFGSYVAGSTPMGGGTIAFPILVLFFELPVTLGRDFAFAIQSVGMTSAAIFILVRRQRLAWSMLGGSLAGSLLGLPLGIILVAPAVPTVWVKMVFAVFWASFGFLHLARLDDFAGRAGQTAAEDRWEIGAGFLTGLLAAVSIVAVTGVGVDMLLYAVLVLVCRVDPKIAIPTSVVAMAFNSVYGMSIKLLVTGVEPGVFANWLAAAPVVALGAPLGAFVVGLIGRRPTLVFVAVLCVIQFCWACYHERATLGLGGIAAATAAVAACLWGLDRLQSGERARRLLRTGRG